MSRLPRTLELPQLLFSCTRSAQNVAMLASKAPMVTLPHHGCPLSEGGPPMPTSLDIVEARWAKSRAPEASVAPGAATGLALLIRSGLFSSPFNLKASRHQSCTPDDILNTLHRCIGRSRHSPSHPLRHGSAVRTHQSFPLFFVGVNAAVAGFQGPVRRRVFAAVAPILYAASSRRGTSKIQGNPARRLGAEQKSWCRRPSLNNLGSKPFWARGALAVAFVAATSVPDAIEEDEFPMQNCVCRSRPETTMRTRVRPGGATSVRGGPAETAADVARGREGLGGGRAVRPSVVGAVRRCRRCRRVVCGARAARRPRQVRAQLIHAHGCWRMRPHRGGRRVRLRMSQLTALRHPFTA